HRPTDRRIATRGGQPNTLTLPFRQFDRRSVLLVVAFIAAYIASDANSAFGGQPAPVPLPLPKLVPGKFRDITSALSIDCRYLSSHTTKKYLIETMGTGAALFDFDNDGRLDIFLVNGAP